MSDLVKLSTKLPGDAEINGLDALHDRLCVETTPVLCLAWVVPTTTTRDLEAGVEVPRVEIRRIEPIGPVKSVPTAIITLAAELYEKRTGRQALPIESLLAPKGEVSEVRGDVEEERLVKADVAAAEMLMGMSPEDREIAMSDGPDNLVQLARGADQIGEVYSFGSEGYGDE